MRGEAVAVDVQGEEAADVACGGLNVSDGLGGDWVGDLPRPPMIRTAGLPSAGDDADGMGWRSAVSAMVAVRACGSAGARWVGRDA